MHTQIIISLLTIAGCAAVALACDYLRAQKAQLWLDLVRQAADKDASAGPRAMGRPASTSASARLAAVQSPVEKVTANPTLSQWLRGRAAARAPQEKLVDSVAEPALSILRSEKGFALIQSSGMSNCELRVPAGIYPAASLPGLLEKRQLFTGLVMSIGVDLGDRGNQEMNQAVEGLVKRLPRNADFCCRLSGDEWVIICPGLHGAYAQRHLNDVSERLWEFQLRTLGRVPIQCHLGGMDVQRESLSDALNTAKERMVQGRRDRMAASLTSFRTEKRCNLLVRHLAPEAD